MLINTDKISGFLEDAENVLTGVLSFPSEVIDFGEDLQSKIEQFGMRVTDTVTEQGVQTRGSNIGSEVASAIYKNKDLLMVAGVAGAIFLLTKK